MMSNRQTIGSRAREPLPAASCGRPLRTSRTLALGAQATARWAGQASAQRACAPPSRTKALRGRSYAVKVVAFRDQPRTEDRAHLLIDATARQFVKAWFQGIMEGPTQEVMSHIDGVTDDAVTMTALGLMEKQSGQGLEFLRQRMSREHDSQAVVEADLMLVAADTDDDIVFCLLEYKMQAGDSDQLEHVYQIMKLSVFLDDTVNRITDIVERSQLTRADLAALHRGDVPLTRVGRQEGVFSSPFPLEDLGLPPVMVDSERLRAVAKAWAKARCSDCPGDKVDVMLHPRFRMWDGYGVLPAVCDASHSMDEAECVVPKKNIKTLLDNEKADYDIDCRVEDVAICADVNAAFMHWCATMKNKATGHEFVVEGLELDVFSEDGRLKDAWVLRDPFDTERQLLQELTEEHGAKA